MALLVVLFIVVPIAELYVIIQVGQLIGLWPTLALLLADALLGSMLLKQQGRSAWRRFNEALAQRRFPGKEVADGVLIVIVIGGTLLLTPGFISDVFGLLLLIPPTRAVARRVLHRFTVGRFTIVGFPSGGGTGPEPPRGTRSYDYDATAEEVPPDEGGRGLPPS
ncbi:MAG TPA: FxsA family protein [Thermoanaerobaculia bacterium]|nr:FxsA family protein [Thermoanaerobaculia bacterium]